MMIRKLLLKMFLCFVTCYWFFLSCSQNIGKYQLTTTTHFGEDSIYSIEAPAFLNDSTLLLVVNDYIPIKVNTRTGELLKKFDFNSLNYDSVIQVLNLIYDSSWTFKPIRQDFPQPRFLIVNAYVNPDEKSAYFLLYATLYHKTPYSSGYGYESFLLQTDFDLNVYRIIPYRFYLNKENHFADLRLGFAVWDNNIYGQYSHPKDSVLNKLGLITKTPLNGDVYAKVSTLAIPYVGGYIDGPSFTTLTALHFDYFDNKLYVTNNKNIFDIENQDSLLVYPVEDSLHIASFNIEDNILSMVQTNGYPKRDSIIYFLKTINLRKNTEAYSMPLGSYWYSGLEQSRLFKTVFYKQKMLIIEKIDGNTFLKIFTTHGK